jgi:hypothetical protein
LINALQRCLGFDQSSECIRMILHRSATETPYATRLPNGFPIPSGGESIAGGKKDAIRNISITQAASRKRINSAPYWRGPHVTRYGLKKPAANQALLESDPKHEQSITAGYLQSARDPPV